MNQTFPTSNTYRFDIWLQRTAPGTLEIANLQFGIDINPAFRGSGTITASVLPGTFSFNGSIANPDGYMQYNIAGGNNGNDRLNVPANGSALTCGQGQMIPDATPGIRYITVELTNTVNWAISNPQATAVFTSSPFLQTKISYLDQGTCNLIDATAAINSNNSAVNVKFFIQGYYLSGGTMKPIMKNESVAGATTSQCDSVTVELHNSSSPQSLAESFKGVANTTGDLACIFSQEAIGNSYYLVIKHRNSLETWSASPVSIASNTTYDFTTDSAKAFGNNMMRMETGKYAIYSGDVNQDGIFQGADFNVMETDVRAIATGYKKTDVNGDGIVQGGDFNLLEENVSAIIQSRRP